MIARAAKTPEIKGWCPGALRPMLSGDGWLVRVRPRGGRLTQAQAAGIAALAAAHGNGAIEISSRANVQLRGVREEALPALTEVLRTLGLIDVNAAAEGRRNILVAPDWVAGDGTQAVVAALEHALAAIDAPDLPGKFGFAVDIGASPALRATPADVRIERTGDALVVRADGREQGMAVTQRGAAEAALALARWFVESGGAEGGRGRMAAHLAQEDTTFPAAFATTAASTGTAPIPAPGPRPAGYLVGFEFGQINSAAFAALAGLGLLRITPWRMVLIEGLHTIPAIPGLITNPRDPRLHVFACIGAPGCAQGLQPTRPLARRIARQRPDPLGPRQITHVSGCAKGCAHPAWADRVVVAQPDGYANVWGGTAADPPEGPVWQADDPEPFHILKGRA